MESSRINPIHKLHPATHATPTHATATPATTTAAFSATLPAGLLIADRRRLTGLDGGGVIGLRANQEDLHLALAPEPPIADFRILRVLRQRAVVAIAKME